MGGFKTVVKMVEGLMEDYKITVPVQFTLTMVQALINVKKQLMQDSHLL